MQFGVINFLNRLMLIKKMCLKLVCKKILTYFVSTNFKNQKPWLKKQKKQLRKKLLRKNLLRKRRSKLKAPKGAFLFSLILFHAKGIFVFKRRSDVILNPALPSGVRQFPHHHSIRSYRARILFLQKDLSLSAAVRPGRTSRPAVKVVQQPKPRRMFRSCTRSVFSIYPPSRSRSSPSLPVFRCTSS